MGGDTLVFLEGVDRVPGQDGRDCAEAPIDVRDEVGRQIVRAQAVKPVEALFRALPQRIV